MYSRILVPLDGSKLAERVLPHAVEFARVFEASLVLLRVLDPTTLGENRQTLEPFAWQISKAEADVYLKTTAERLRQQQGQEVKTVLLEGKAAETIIDYTQNHEIDLLVISTHGASGLSRWSASSIFQKVISKVYKHILIIRAYHGIEPDEPALEPQSHVDKPVAQGSAAADGNFPPVELLSTALIPTTSQKKPAAGDEENPPAPNGFYQRILIPIDTSRRAECSLPAASRLVECGGTTVILAAVIRQPEIAFPPERTNEVNELNNRLMQISHETIEVYLGEIQARLGGKAEVRIVESDSVQYAIHDLAEQEDASLVVFCAHGYTGKMKWPYGSVVQNYIDHGTRPVLVVQDLPLSQVRPTAAELAAEKYGKR